LNRWGFPVSFGPPLSRSICVPELPPGADIMREVTPNGLAWVLSMPGREDRSYVQLAAAVEAAWAACNVKSKL
jgi:hypothetical protein